MGRTTATSSAISPMHPNGAAFSPMPSSGSSHSPMTGGRSAPPAELATALRRSRSGIFREGDGTLYRPPLSPTARAAAGAMARWEPEVRVDIGVASLMSGLSFAGTTWSYAPGLPLATLIAPSDPVFKTYQLPQVQTAANDRDDRLPEILSQAGGLWPFWTSITNLDATNAPSTAELIEVLLNTTHLMTMRLKHALAVPRPVDLSSTIGPVIPTPGHGSFPSGHSTVSFMFAAFMERLLGVNLGSSTSTYLRRLANRIAQNRVVAGVHFPIDSVAGRLLGETLAEYFYARCTGDAALYSNATFDGTSADQSVNLDGEPPAPLSIAGCTAGTSISSVARDNEVLGVMWDNARLELKGLGLMSNGS